MEKISISDKIIQEKKAFNSNSKALEINDTAHLSIASGQTKQSATLFNWGLKGSKVFLKLSI